MPLLPVFHILMILKRNPNKTKTETWVTTLDILGKLHSKVKYMHAIQTLSITASYLLLLISSVKGGPSRVTILLH